LIAQNIHFVNSFSDLIKNLCSIKLSCLLDLHFKSNFACHYGLSL
jgi:hypothetical protein